MTNVNELDPEVRANLGSRRVPPLPAAKFPDAGAAVQTLTSSTRPTDQGARIRSAC